MQLIEKCDNLFLEENKKGDCLENPFFLVTDLNLFSSSIKFHNFHNVLK